MADKLEFIISVDSTTGVADMRKFEQELGVTNETAKKTSTVFKDLINFEVLKRSFDALIGFFKDSFREAQEAAKSTAVFANSVKSIGENYGQVNAQIKSMAKVNAFDDDELKKVYAYGVGIGVAKDKLVQYVQTTIDFAASKGTEDLGFAMRSVGNAAKEGGEKFETLSKNVQGMGKAFAEADGGIRKARVSIGELQETIGKGIQLGLTEALKDANEQLSKSESLAEKVSYAAYTVMVEISNVVKQILFLPDFFTTAFERVKILLNMLGLNIKLKFEEVYLAAMETLYSIGNMQDKKLRQRIVDTATLMDNEKKEIEDLDAKLDKLLDKAPPKWINPMTLKEYSKELDNVNSNLSNISNSEENIYSKTEKVNKFVDVQAEKLKEIQTLRESGVITEGKYIQLKTEILKADETEFLFLKMKIENGQKLNADEMLQLEGILKRKTELIKKEDDVNKKIKDGIELLSRWLDLAKDIATTMGEWSNATEGERQALKGIEEELTGIFKMVTGAMSSNPLLVVQGLWEFIKGIYDTTQGLNKEEKEITKEKEKQITAQQMLNELLTDYANKLEGIKEGYEALNFLEGGGEKTPQLQKSEWERKRQLALTGVGAMQGSIDTAKRNLTNPVNVKALAAVQYIKDLIAGGFWGSLTQDARSTAINNLMGISTASGIYEWTNPDVQSMAKSLLKFINEINEADYNIDLINKKLAPEPMKPEYPQAPAGGAEGRSPNEDLQNQIDNYYLAQAKGDKNLEMSSVEAIRRWYLRESQSTGSVKMQTEFYKWDKIRNDLALSANKPSTTENKVNEPEIIVKTPEEVLQDKIKYQKSLIENIMAGGEGNLSAEQKNLINMLTESLSLAESDKERLDINTEILNIKNDMLEAEQEAANIIKDEENKALEKQLEIQKEMKNIQSEKIRQLIDLGIIDIENIGGRAVMQKALLNVGVKGFEQDVAMKEFGVRSDRIGNKNNYFGEINTYVYEANLNTLSGTMAQNLTSRL